MPVKKKALTLTIPEPCSKNFDKMTPVKGGKFCDSCEKTIVDFRTMSDGQIINHYKKNNGKVCGVFNEVQLNRTMPFPMEIQPNRNWKAVAALAAGLVFTGVVAGQSVAPKTGELAVVERTIVKEKYINKSNQVPIKRLKGVVLGASIDEPLIGANVLVKGTTIGASTNFEGHFELQIPENLNSFEIEVSFIGFETQILSFNDQGAIPNKRIDIVLADGPLLEEVVVVGYGIVRKGELTGAISVLVSESEYIPEPEIIEEETITKLPEVKIFPNPFVSNLNVTYNYDTKGEYLFHLYDMNGRLLFAKTYNLLKGKQTIELDVANKHLIDGVYILQISDKQDRILATKKVFKGQA